MPSNAEPGDDEDDYTQVIFSLDVNSDHPIAALSEFPGRHRSPRASDDFHYAVDHFSFEEDDWSSRADKLDAAVHKAIDRLEATGIDPEELREPGVLVRAFFTFGFGAETISAELVERLACFHATIWIDANG